MLNWISRGCQDAGGVIWLFGPDRGSFAIDVSGWVMSKFGHKTAITALVMRVESLARTWLFKFDILRLALELCGHHLRIIWNWV